MDVDQDAPLFCIDCGNEIHVAKFVSRSRKKRCTECQKAYELDYQADYQAVYRSARTSYRPSDTHDFNKRTIQLIYDPSGDFRPGARFTVSDFVKDRTTITRKSPAFECWDPGMIFIDLKTKIRYRITETSTIEVL